jgi:hypothetical protein
MDGEDYNASTGNVSEVVEQVKQVNTGVISIKLVGEGSFASREDRPVSLKFAFNNAGVDASPSAT